MSSKFYYLILIVWIMSCQSLVHAQVCNDISLDDITNPGVYNYATINQNDGIRNGPDYDDATIYYPTDAQPPFAGIAMVTGFLSDAADIQAWGPFLASNGIIVINIETNSGFDSPADRADGLIDALETLRAENDRTASPLFGKIDTDRFAVAGWSMGGGGAQLAASLDPTLKAILAFCPWLGNPSSSDLDHNVPLLILSGEDDTTAPPNNHADEHYALTPASTDKMLFEVAGGDHRVANDPANVQEEMGKYGLAWLRYYLLEDSCHCPLVLQPSTATSEYLTNVICPEIPACVIVLNINETIIDDGLYQAAETVTATGTVPANGVVMFKAGQTVSLEIGFAAVQGADLALNIEDCLQSQ